MSQSQQYNSTESKDIYEPGPRKSSSSSPSINEDSYDSHKVLTPKAEDIKQKSRVKSLDKNFFHDM